MRPAPSRPRVRALADPGAPAEPGGPEAPARAGVPARAGMPAGPGGRARRGIRLLALGLALGLGGAAACASTPAGPARRNAAERPPPFPVAPDFKVTDAAGAPRDLASVMGARGLVLVLYRGHW